MNHTTDMNLAIKNIWTINCYDCNGNLKWGETKKNLVTTAGLNHILSSTFDGGTQITTWYVGLKNAGSVAGLLLTTDCMITDIPEAEKAAPGGHDHDHGMM